MHSQEDLVSEEPSFAVKEGWQQTAEARGYINALLKRNKRRSFGENRRNAHNSHTREYLLQIMHVRCVASTGVLEHPMLDQHRNLFVLSHKLFLLGKAGVGKTSTVDKLCGRGESIMCCHVMRLETTCLSHDSDISPSHEETLGIQTTTVYWPAKVPLFLHWCSRGQARHVM